jgi:hypothetical protein
MPKKKNVKKQSVEEKVSLVEWAEGDTHIGTPTMLLLPARNYYFKVSKKEHKITVPRKGIYKDIDPKVYKEEDGDFLLLDEKHNVLYMPAISKVLFACEAYPDLKNSQLFAPIALVFREDEVDIIGQVIEMLEPPSSTV